jgi:hypothetical protein
MLHLLQERSNLKLVTRWNIIQYELIPELTRDVGPLTPKLEQVVHTLEWVRAEEYCAGGCGVGRPLHERAWMANAFVTKVVLNLATTVGLIERLTIDHVLPIETRERAARPVNTGLEVKRSVKRQRGQNLNEMHKEIPTAFDRGSKKNQAPLAGLQTAP